MSLTLGEKLQQAREERGISISEVAEQTRISALYLEAIENNDYRILPGGIFNKGFVKSYAKYVGVDEQEALQDYSKLIAQQEFDAGDEPKTYRPEVLTDDRTSTSMLPTIIFAVIILGLMSWGILALVQYISENQGQTPINQSNSASNSITNNANNSQTQPNHGPAQAAPLMSELKVEFKSVNGDISLSSNTDGKKGVNLVSPEKPVSFDPKESLSLSFAKSLVQNARLTINGKQITLPSEPKNPNRIPIEFEINKNNIGQIWQSGAITFDNSNAANANTASR